MVILPQFEFLPSPNEKPLQKTCEENHLRPRICYFSSNVTRLALLGQARLFCKREARALVQTGCRLENWEGHRSPLAYWSLGKRWFRPEIFNRQTTSDVCALRGANYQLMRNFLFAASIAERDRKSRFGVLAIVPRKYSSVLAEQVAAFRRDILLPEFQNLIAFVDYQAYADILDAANDNDAAQLAEFLRKRIHNVLG